MQGELDQERQQHEAMIAAMREEEKFKVDRMARDLEIKWTENLRQVLLFFFYSIIRNELCIICNCAIKQNVKQRFLLFKIFQLLLRS